MVLDDNGVSRHMCHWPSFWVCLALFYSIWQANKVADTRTPAEKRAAAREALDEAENLLHQVAGASAPIRSSDVPFISVGYVGDGHLATNAA